MDFHFCSCRVVVGDSAVPVYGNGQVALCFLQHDILRLSSTFKCVMSPTACIGHACKRVHYDMSAQAVAWESVLPIMWGIRIPESTRHTLVNILIFALTAASISEKHAQAVSQRLFGKRCGSNKMR
jgi:hypothetical protein